MTYIDIIEKMPEAPATFTLADFVAVAGTENAVARKSLSRAGQRGLVEIVAHGGRGTRGNPAIYRRTDVDPQTVREENQARILSGGRDVGGDRFAMRTPAANSVFHLAG